MADTVKVINLRAHHLLCILGFRGLGYSKKFVENMKKVIQEVGSGNYIKVADEADVICPACPYNQNNKCQREEGSEKRVKERDRRIIKRIGIQPGDEIPSPKLWRAIAERITPAEMERICSGCEWLELGYCLEGLRSLRDGNHLARSLLLQAQRKRGHGSY